MFKIIVLLGLLTNLASSKIVVISSEKSQLSHVSKKELTNIYLKKTTKIRGISVTPINNRKSYAEFCKKVMKRTPKQLRAYWARELYKGNKKPPKILNSKQIKKAINANAQIISYASHKLTGKIILKVTK